MMQRWLPYLAIVSLVYFVALAIFTTFWLSSSGMIPFDGQFLGYSFNGAQAYLDDMSSRQVALYRGPFRVADTIFPALVTLTLHVWFRSQTTGAVLLGLMMLVVLYLAADYTENMLVARLIDLGADAITVQEVSTASVFTQTKWAILLVCLIAAAGLWFKSRSETSS